MFCVAERCISELTPADVRSLCQFASFSSLSFFEVTSSETGVSFCKSFFLRMSFTFRSLYPGNPAHRLHIRRFCLQIWINGLTIFYGAHQKERIHPQSDSLSTLFAGFTWETDGNKSLHRVTNKVNRYELVYLHEVKKKTTGHYYMPRLFNILPFVDTQIPSALKSEKWLQGERKTEGQNAGFPRRPIFFFPQFAVTCETQS